MNYNDFPNWDNEIKRLHYSESDFLELFEDKALEFEPGEKVNYSNTGFYLLGAIIKRVTNISFVEFIRENILQKLELNNTDFVTDNEIVLNMANGYVYNGPVLVKGPFAEMTKIQSPGGLYSTCEDLYRFIKALKSYELISKDSFELMFQNYHSGWGYGSNIGESFNRKTIGHNGSYCGFLAQYMYYPQDDVFVCVLSNNSYTNVWRLCDELAAITFEESIPIPKKPNQIKEVHSEFNEYLGIYEDEWGFKITISRSVDIFNLQFNNDNPYVIYPVAKDEFFNEILDEKYIFRRNENNELSLWGCRKLVD
jgi:CubicO group peptidase (beta-lactamase class C family)